MKPSRVELLAWDEREIGSEFEVGNWPGSGDPCSCCRGQRVNTICGFTLSPFVELLATVSQTWENSPETSLTGMMVFLSRECRLSSHSGRDSEWTEPVCVPVTIRIGVWSCVHYDEFFNLDIMSHQVCLIGVSGNVTIFFGMTDYAVASFWC